MRIEQHDVGGRVLLQDGAQDERRGAGLARAGRAEDGEVLAEQLVDADHRGNSAVLTDAADADRAAGLAAEGSAQLRLRRDAHAVAERGICGDAAREDGRLAGLVAPQLADEAELGDPDLGFVIAMRRNRDAQSRHDR